MRTLTFLLLVFAGVASFSLIGTAQQSQSTSVPNLISYSGTLKGVRGQGQSSRVVGITFLIYKQQEGGAPLWLETQNVSVDGTGHYAVQLGTTKTWGIPTDLFSSQEERWLAVQVEGQEEQERVLLVSVPYAFKAHEAENATTLGGLPPSAYVTTNSQQAASAAAATAATSRFIAAQPQAASVRPATLGHGTQGYIARWQNSLYLRDSGLFQDSNLNLGLGTTTPAAKLDVNGGVNVAATYQIGGSTVVDIGTSGDNNLFLGVQAGSSNVAGQGTWNTFTGYQAGLSNNTGNANTFSGFQSGLSNTAGVANVFNGYQAGYSNTTGYYNTFSGFSAGYSDTAGFFNTFSGTYAGYSNTTGSENTFYGTYAGLNNKTGSANTFSGDYAGSTNITGDANVFNGYQAGYGNTSGGNNVFDGYQSGYANTSGGGNVFDGYQAGYANTTGGGNTFSGDSAGANNTTGSYNTFVGVFAGDSINTGQYNIDIGAFAGVNFNESNTIRIGDSYFQTDTYIGGIYNSPIGTSGTAVYINAVGKLGVVTSSRRFKEQIHDMGDSTNALMKLRPVTFLYKPEFDKGPRTLQYGLIAEEVAEVYPDLVTYESDGMPYTVKYQYLTTMLLNEMQKQYHRVNAQAEVISAQEQKIDELKAELQMQSADLKNQNEQLQQRLTRVETLMQSPMNSVVLQTVSGASLQPKGTQK